MSSFRQRTARLRMPLQVSRSWRMGSLLPLLPPFSARYSRTMKRTSSNRFPTVLLMYSCKPSASACISSSVREVICSTLNPRSRNTSLLILRTSYFLLQSSESICFLLWWRDGDCHTPGVIGMQVTHDHIDQQNTF